ncbi:MAG: twin-arginine translocase subunit TatC [Candidatus Kuenenia sp.]|nr:twin-arginine translocase subunit TatC [Candidatus Kuenenia hertensis]
MDITGEEEEYRKIEEARMPLGSHLEELRRRVFYSIIAIILCFIMCWVFKLHIMDIMKRPHGIAMRKLGLSTELQVLSYQEGFYAYMKLCFISSLFLMYPVIIYQAWKFVSAGLFAKEKKYILVFFPVSYIAFVMGGLFGYYLLIPFGLQFLISILGPDIQPIITMQQYVSFVFLLTVALGLVFQLPLVMLLLSKIGFVSADKFVKWRKYSILAIFIIAAIVTPPDPFTQTMTAAPMILLYELGILVAKPTKRGFILLGTVVGFSIIAMTVAYFYFTHKRRIIDLSHTYGNMQLQQGEDQKWKNISMIDSLHSGVTLKTGNGEKASFSTKKGIDIHMDSNTEMSFVNPWKINVKKGQLFISLEKLKKNLEIFTPNGKMVTNNGIFNLRITDYVTIVTAVKGEATLLAEGEEKKLLEGRQRKMTIGGEPVDIHSIIDWSEGIIPDTQEKK